MKKFSIILGLVFTLFTTLCFNLKAEELATNNNTNNNNCYNNLYVGVGAGAFVENRLDFIKKSTNRKDYYAIYENNLDFFIGFNINKYIALELGYNHFLENTDTIPAKLKEASTSIDSGNTIYANSVFKYSFNKKHTPFISIGLGQTNFNTEYNFYKGNSHLERNGLSYIVGAGYEYALTYKHVVGVKYNYNIISSIDFEEIGSGGYYYQKNDVEKINYSNINLYYKYNF